MTWAEADVRCAFGKSCGGPEANGSDGSCFGKNLTVFGIPTPVTGAREAIGSMLQQRCFRMGTSKRRRILRSPLFFSRDKKTRERRQGLRAKAEGAGTEGQRRTGRSSGQTDAVASRRGHRSRRNVVTWLILPVVICLSQRLSHACLSTNFYTVKLRMAH